jgi:hypothetical protein
LNAETTAVAQRRIKCDITTMSHNNTLDNLQAEDSTGELAIQTTLNLHERVEYPIMALWIDTDS